MSRRGTILGLRTCALLGAGLVCLAYAALAQTAGNFADPAARPAADPQTAAPPPAVAQPAAPAPSAEAPNPNYRPGFIDAFGRWLQEGREKFDAQMKGARDALGDFHNKARDNANEAAGAFTAVSRVVNGHVRCDIAQNGAPDCTAAANTVCTGKGYKTGKSMATQTEEKCPARVWLSGRSPQAGECKIETFVTRAVCQ